MKPKKPRNSADRCLVFGPSSQEVSFFAACFLKCLLETGNFLSESVLNSGFPYSPLLKRRTIKAMSRSFTAAPDSCR